MPVIAVDGLAASGKGTLAKRLAAHFGFAYLNTGLLYRAVAAKVITMRAAYDDSQTLARLAHALAPDDLDEITLSREVYGTVASRIAINPALRAALLDYQRSFAEQDQGAVLDGRDIGTVVCPEAEAKLFVTASAEVRARRRLLQESVSFTPEILTKVVADLEKRDAQDRERPSAPMIAADDALLLDTTKLSIDETLLAALELIKGRFQSLSK